MKKIVTGALLVAGVGSLLLSTGCSNACDDLDCDACAADAFASALCLGLVDEDDGDACQEAIDAGFMDSCQ